MSLGFAGVGLPRLFAPCLPGPKSGDCPWGKRMGCGGRDRKHVDLHQGKCPQKRTVYNRRVLVLTALRLHCDTATARCVPCSLSPFPWCRALLVAGQGGDRNWECSSPPFNAILLPRGKGVGGVVVTPTAVMGDVKRACPWRTNRGRGSKVK